MSPETKVRLQYVLPSKINLVEQYIFRSCSKYKILIIIFLLSLQPAGLHHNLAHVHLRFLALKVLVSQDSKCLVAFYNKTFDNYCSFYIIDYLNCMVSKMLNLLASSWEKGKDNEIWGRLFISH